MTIIPAIDLIDGQVVRLSQGKFTKKTTYDVSPVDLCSQYAEAGAKRVHIVDLEGAKTGKSTQTSVIEQVCASTKLKVQVGGGVRSPEMAEKLFSKGVHKVVIGTRACTDKVFLSEMLSAFGSKVIVGIDAIEGKVATQGWTQVNDILVASVLDNVAIHGGSEVIFTDISRDGMMQGPNIQAIDVILNYTKIHVIASGGVSSIDDIQRFLSIKAPHLIGVIVGKAIYEGGLNLKKAIDLCSQNV